VFFVLSFDGVGQNHKFLSGHRKSSSAARRIRDRSLLVRVLTPNKTSRDAQTPHRMGAARADGAFFQPARLRARISSTVIRGPIGVNAKMAELEWSAASLCGIRAVPARDIDSLIVAFRSLVSMS